MPSSAQLSSNQPDPIVSKWQEETAKKVNDIAGIIHQRLKVSVYEQKEIKAIDPLSILPFKSSTLPANEDVLARQFPGYVEPSDELLAELREYADSKANYGSAPGEAAAVIVQLAKAIEPETAFVFGTARGRVEQLIAKNTVNTEIATIDIPTELLKNSIGKPDSNNIRYREKIGIEEDNAIGDIFTSDPSIKSRIHQILGDSFTFDPKALAGTMRMMVVDGNHQLPNSLMDLASSLELAHKNGAVIVVDDFRKTSPLNTGVEAAVSCFSQITGLVALTPCPRPGETGLQAAAAIIVVPADMNNRQELIQEIKAMAVKLKSFEN